MTRAPIAALVVLGMAACGVAEPSPGGGLPSTVVVAVRNGVIIEVLADGRGPIAWHRVAADAAGAWLPPGDAAFVDGAWWSLLRPPPLVRSEALPPAFPFGDVIASGTADVDDDGDAEFVVSYRHPARSVPWDPLPPATDLSGRTAHLGVLDGDGTPLWLAHRVPHPIGALAACGVHIALGYTTFVDDTVVTATAATWIGFGFTLAPELPGPAEVGCGDIDGDGVLDPVVLGR